MITTNKILMSHKRYINVIVIGVSVIKHIRFCRKSRNDGNRHNRLSITIVMHQVYMVHRFIGNSLLSELNSYIPRWIFYSINYILLIIFLLVQLGEQLGPPSSRIEQNKENQKQKDYNNHTECNIQHIVIIF